VHASSAVSAAAPRRLAANLLEAQLLRLARAGAVIERRLGPGLLALSARRLYRRLGFVRLGDYLTERLGMSLRRCQSIVRLERALRDLPAVATAFDAGVLPPSKVRIVASVAAPETQDLWLARAQRLTVRDLEAAARAAGQATRRDESDDQVSAAGTPTAQETEAAGSPAQEGAQTHPLAPEDESGVLISFAAPGRAFALWHWALEFVRRVAGRQEPAWRCAEYLAAEFLSGSPDTDGADEARALSGCRLGDTDTVAHTVRAEGDPSPASLPPRRPTHCAISDEDVWARAVAAVRDALRPLGSAADVETILSAPPPAVVAGPPTRPWSEAPAAATASPPEPIRPGTLPPAAASEAAEPDPWSLDGRLRSLVRLRQSLAWRQGRLLAAVASFDLYRELGFDSLGDWCQCILGMSPRRARYLVSLDWRLDRLPLVADAYRRGIVSWCQARLLVRVARPGTESRWVRYARRVTVRRLEDVVTASAVAAADPALGDGGLTSAEGAPVPPAEPLPERHTFAPREVADSPALPFDLPHSSRHTLAPEASPPGGGSPPLAFEPPRHTFAPREAEAGRHTFAPEPCTHRIAFWAPLDVADVWRSALRSCRATRGPHLRDWECLLIFIIEMRDAWQPNENAEWRRRYHILERDGWRCLVPGCTSRSHLNAHHVVFRSHCGSDDASNLVTLCVGHHQAGVHDNLIRCSGRAPDALWWEFGIRPDGPPLVRYFGERIVGAAAPAGESQALGGRTEIGRRGDPPSTPPVRGETPPRKGSGSCRPLAEFRQQGAAPRAPGL
jgi:hypothetical protein